MFRHSRVFFSIAMVALVRAGAFAEEVTNDEGEDSSADQTADAGSPPESDANEMAASDVQEAPSSALEAAYDSDANEPFTTDLSEDPTNVEYTWEVQETNPGDRPFVERISVGDESRVDAQDRGVVRRWGGKPVAAGGAPWLAAISGASSARQREDGARDWIASHQCGGVLIGNFWVLTSAHCVMLQDDRPVNPSDLRVIVGSEDLTRYDDGIEFGVDKVVRHADYSRSDRSEPPNMYDADIALLHLINDGKPRDPRQVHPIERIGDSVSPGTIATTSNWYRYRDPDDHRERALLLKFDMETMAPADCRETEGHDQPWKLNQRVFCASNPERIVCNGDSGSPVVRAQGVPTLVGLTSWGRDTCNLANELGVYTQVAPFRDWIARAESAAMASPAAEAFLVFR